MTSDKPKPFAPTDPKHEPREKQQHIEAEGAGEGYLPVDHATKKIDRSRPKERKPRISPKLQEVIRLLLSGECKTQRAASERVGVSETNVSEALRRPHVIDFIHRRVRSHLAAGTLSASRRMLELIDGPSAPTAFDASKFVLGVAGVKPATEPQVSVNIEVKAGYVIDLSEPDARVIDVKADDLSAKRLTKSTDDSEA